jgi:hypothetical protein
MLDLSNQSSDTFVGRLVAAGGDDPLRQRLRLSRLLSGADFRPTGMPASSILLIRKLRDPSPQLLSFGAKSGVVSPEWQQGVRNSVGQFMRLAARPAAGEFSNCEDAVLFMDRAELLACLARDWCTHRMVERWWWRALLRNDYSFWTTWIRNPEYIPAAVTQLARTHIVSAFAAALTDQEARLLTERVIEVFALRGLEGMFEWSMLRAPTQDQSAQSNPKQVSRAADVEGHASQLPAPWHGVLQEAAAVSLPLPQQLFVGLALMIHKAPSLVRTARFALDVARWRRQKFEAELKLTHAGKPDAQTISPNASPVQDLAPLDDRATPIEIQSNNYQRERDLEFALIEQSQDSVVPIAPVTVGEREVHELSESELFSGEPQGTSADQLVQDLQVGLTNEVSGDFLKETPRPIASFQPTAIETENEKDDIPRVSNGKDVADSDFLADAQTESLIDQSVETETFVGVEIETALGGFIYLINLALYLELYGDFTRPNEAGIELNIWDFVTLVGRELVSDAHADDPIWSLLAILAGRDEDEPAGQSFEPEDDWRLPPDWLSTFTSERPWRWSANRGRLRVLHPAGFAVLDLRLESNPEQLQRELEPYGILASSLSRARKPRLKPLKANIAGGPRLGRWLSLLMPYVRARLRVALGLESDADVATTLCRCHARVHASDTHVDVYFGLADLRLPIRFAGLDRDPGWVPGAGRFIAFHFD